MATMHQSIHSISPLLERRPNETSLWSHLGTLGITDLEAVNTTIPG